MVPMLPSVLVLSFLVVIVANNSSDAGRVKDFFYISCQNVNVNNESCARARHLYYHSLYLEGR